MAKVIFSRGEFSKTLSGDRFSFFIFFTCSFLVLFLSSLILVSWGKLPPEVPLYYTRVWGQQMLASPVYLWILPGISVFVTILNFLLASLVAGGDLQSLRQTSASGPKQSFSMDRFLARILLIFALLVSLAATYTGTKIISLLT